MERAIVSRVERVNGKVKIVVIEFYPFTMIFVERNKKVHLSSRFRDDKSRCDDFWIPPEYFNPAMKIARAIFLKK